MKKKKNRFVYTRSGIRSIGTNEEKIEGLKKAIKLVKKVRVRKSSGASKKSYK